MRSSVSGLGLGYLPGGCASVSNTTRALCPNSMASETGAALLTRLEHAATHLLTLVGAGDALNENSADAAAGLTTPAWESDVEQAQAKYRASYEALEAFLATNTGDEKRENGGAQPMEADDSQLHERLAELRRRRDEGNEVLAQLIGGLRTVLATCDVTSSLTGSESDKFARLTSSADATAQALQDR